MSYHGCRGTEKERFWGKVNILGADDCWLWLASGRPYGHLNVVRDEKHVYTDSHKLAWEYANGPIPNGLLVCHRCDVKLCCNPGHLFLGSVSDNIQDYIAKNGVGAWEKKLSQDDKLLIKEMLAEKTFAQAELAKRFNVSESRISQIKE